MDEKEIFALIEKNNTFLKENSPPEKNLELIYRFSQSYLSNAFIYMVLNRLHRKKVKFEYSTKYLEDYTKNINYFFLIWDTILDNNSYLDFHRKSADFYSQLPNQKSIHNFYQTGLAIDQSFKLFQNEKNFQQLLSFKKKNILLVLALVDVKKIYIEIDPMYPNSSFYQQFINLIKKETLEYVHTELTHHSLIDLSKRQIRPIKNLISFGEHLSHFLINFGEDESTTKLKKKIKSCKRYLLELEKSKKNTDHGSNTITNHKPI